MIYENNINKLTIKGEKMAKKQKNVQEKQDEGMPAMPGFDPKQLPKDAQKKLKDMKKKLDTFQKKVLEKFDKYIMGIALLPPRQAFPQNQMNPPMDQPAQEQPKINKDEINVLVLVDDSDSKKMSKFELKDKLTTIIGQIAKETDENFVVSTVIITELWQNCYDAKHEMLQTIAMGAPIFDRGMLSAIKIAEIHKTMILKKFERYIVSYVLAGSLVQGKATQTSDIDVWIVVDDTDVKKMTRLELKDKLRAIIIGMGIEAGSLTGIKNKLNVQVYILTDFWDSLKEANPVIFTLLRDGVPFFDRGIFMPWKQLLKMGKIKPSPEAKDMFMQSGHQLLSRIDMKLKEIGMEDTFWSILTPSQAALMLYGVPPPTPKETPDLMRELFVKKEKLLEERYVKILEKNIQIRKDLEHGTRKELSGKEIDELIKDANDYLTRIKKLFSEIELIRESKDVVELYDALTTVIRDVLKDEGVEKVTDVQLIKILEDELISTGKIPAKFLRMINEVIGAKADYESKKLNKTEIEKAKKDMRELIKFFVEYIQRKRGRELERTRIRVKYGDKYGDIYLLGKQAFIIHDIDTEQKQYSKAEITDKGGITSIQNATVQEFEKAIASFENPGKVFIKEKIFEDLKGVFGSDVEVLVNY